MISDFIKMLIVIFIIVVTGVILTILYRKNEISKSKLYILGLFVVCSIIIFCLHLKLVLWYKNERKICLLLHLLTFFAFRNLISKK